jgi:arsenate reductase (thioredoxin)
MQNIMNHKKLAIGILISFCSFTSLGQIKKTGKDTMSLPTILFVCEHGAARSTIAATYFNKIAIEKGLKYKAIFRATSPDTALTIATKKGLTEDGFDIQNMKPILVTQRDINFATQIITFDCSLPTKDSLSSKVSKWNGIPPISRDYQVARNEIVSKVEGLISDLQKKKKVDFDP